MAKVDLEQLKVMAEMMKPVKDNDSFNSLTNTLSKNSWLIMAVVGVALWLISGINDGKNIDQIQNTRIDSNAAAIEKLVGVTEAIANNGDLDRSNQQNVNSEILSSIKLIQKDIEIIKNSSK